MANTIELRSERTFRLVYEEGSYPGWKLGEKIPSPLTGPDGTIYVSIGSMLVDEVHQVHGTDVIVAITNYPGIK